MEGDRFRRWRLRAFKLRWDKGRLWWCIRRLRRIEGSRSFYRSRRRLRLLKEGVLWRGLGWRRCRLLWLEESVLLRRLSLWRSCLLRLEGDLWQRWGLLWLEGRLGLEGSLGLEGRLGLLSGLKGDRCGWSSCLL